MRIIQLDQGSVNTHQALIQIKGITFILSHKGTYVDNAIIKTCHSPLKSEMFY
ncbi:hypothetical protein NBX27_07405 [Erysipelothrix rhusiopathiae]|uniref:hypothetical protein n=1 Tax=Erysipelothrix rhusiopathiae TaxID=1648 RepID=UPI00202AD6F1|nr:hypothetical protein [Erysipelothrix rhusiopathiae]URQ77070.1 hypothetical protein NBX27_07405 [Erysipelothrix rhusiopathiae]